ncbi:MAG: hypothetical protein HY367_02445 [Candidatus Aenigmarchaeota archaeon]|nr:hypothetical protein [Candidatus Aenigmarchaeota archaeon]
MKTGFAEELLDELSAHPGIIRPDRNMFMCMLTPVAALEYSGRFDEPLPEDTQMLEEDRCYHYLSLRRLLSNRHARDSRLSPLDNAYEALVSAFGFHSSDSWARGIRAEEELVDMMDASRHPYSLICKFQTYDYCNPGEDLFVITKPVLVIPGAKDKPAIYAWEDANTKYQEEVRAFLGYRKRISRDEYLERSNPVVAGKAV